MGVGEDERGERKKEGEREKYMAQSRTIKYKKELKSEKVEEYFQTYLLNSQMC